MHIRGLWKHSFVLSPQFSYVHPIVKRRRSAARSRMRALEGMTHQMGSNSGSAKLGQDTIYLCNFRVSVDGEWLCLKELHDLDGQDSSAGATIKGRLADGSHHHRLLHGGGHGGGGGGGIGTNNYRNSWNGSEGIGGRKGNRFYDTSDDLLVGRTTAVTNKRFSDSNCANFFCRCLGSVS